MPGTIQISATPEAHPHQVQLYGSDDDLLIRTVVAYLREGLDVGEGLLVIGTEEHNKSFFNGLRDSGADVARALRDGRLCLLDAAETLDRFMINGSPDESLFQALVTKAVGDIRPSRNCRQIRAYGEMVGILWTRGEHQAALRLEEYWNKFLEAGEVRLFCGYPIDLFGGANSHRDIAGVLSCHTHLVSPEDENELRGAASRSVLSILGLENGARAALEALSRLEEANLQHARELKRSNGELQSFAYAAAHDLKEPLRSVSAFAQLLANENESAEKRREYAHIVIDSVNRMSALLDDLLEFSSVSFCGEPREVDLNEIVSGAKLNLATAIRETGTRLEAEPLPMVLGNKAHLMVLFQHLLANSIKYRGAEPLRITIGAERSGVYWILRVRDNGIGIAPEFAERIFGLFKRLHGPEIPGTGLGLALCRKIVEGGGGRIWTESMPEQGSTFCFTARAVLP